MVHGLCLMFEDMFRLIGHVDNFWGVIPYRKLVWINQAIGMQLAPPLCSQNRFRRTGLFKAQSLKGGSVPGRLSQLCAFT